jgi:TfoX/Sxy family transcriptional regulator of competence genes
MVYDLVTAERVRHLLADRHDVAEKKMMGGLCFMVKGGMCCAVSGRGGMLVRVGPDAPRLVKEPHVKPMRMAGRIAKNFIRVMPEAYRTTAQLRKWIDRSVAFTTTLPPKTKRPRSR